MRSLQVRLTIRLGLGILAAFSSILVALNLYAVHQVAMRGRDYLKGIALSIADAASAAGAPEVPLPESVSQAIAEHLAFVDRQRRLAAAVYTTAGQEIYRSAHFGIPVDAGLLQGGRSRLRLVGVESGPEVSDALSLWRVLYRHQVGGLIVLVSDVNHFELAEKLTEGVVLAALLALLLALPLGHTVSRRVLRPFHAIDEAAARVRRGELHSRIPTVTRTPEVRQLIDALNATFAELEASFQRIEQFSADAAHELRTPLTALRGNLEVCLAQERSPEEYQVVLAASIQDVSCLSNMVQDLLLLASPGGADRRLAFATVDVCSVVRDVAERLALVAENSGVKIVTDLAAEAALPGDALLLHRAVYNLVHNAVRYSSRDALVTVVVRRAAGAVVITVLDHGVGIPKDQQERIFERFFRLDPGRSTGTGLGLSMVRWIVALHGGRIELESEPGRGSEFRLILPVTAQ
jgi:heavy metal sensor kinase